MYQKNKLKVQIDSSQSIYVSQTPKGTQQVIPRICFDLNDGLINKGNGFCQKIESHPWELSFKVKKVQNCVKAKNLISNYGDNAQNRQNNDIQDLKRSPLKFLQEKIQTQNYWNRNQSQIHTFRENFDRLNEIRYPFACVSQKNNRMPDLEKRGIFSARENQNFLEFSEIQICSPSCSQFFSGNFIQNQNPQQKQQNCRSKSGRIKIKQNQKISTDKRISTQRSLLQNQMEQIYRGKFKIRRD